MPGANGQQHPQQQPMPEPPAIDTGPVNMAIDAEATTFRGAPFVVVRFGTAQGSNEFWLTRPQAQAFARMLLEVAGGLVLPS